MWYNNHDIRTEDLPTPSPGQGEILVKVISCGICGSDIVEWYRLPRAPLVQGHEVGAEVVETGEGVTRFKKGDRLFIAPKVACLACDQCLKGHYPQCSQVQDRLPGGFAEYILVPGKIVQNGCHLLPDHVGYDQAIFIEPLACVVRAQEFAAVGEGKTLLVIGCGTTGLLHIKLARHKNCRVIASDINPEKLDLARRVGAEHVADATSDDLGQLMDGEWGNADAVMVTTSALPALNQAWRTVAMGGIVVLFAVPGPDEDVVVPVNDLWRKEVRIITSYYCGPPDIEEALGLITGGDIQVDDLITHRLPLEDTKKGFEMLRNGGNTLKIIIKPQEG